MDLMSGTVTITAPALSDGRGGTAVLNNTADSTNFVGYVFDTSGFDGASVRSSIEELSEGHGAVFGSFWRGAREFTIEVDLRPSTTFALSNARRDKLYRSFNAFANAGTVAWTESGGSARQVEFIQSQPPRGPDKEGHVLLSGVCADPRIYAATADTPHATTGTNDGNADSPPTWTFTPSGNGTVILTNTTSGLGSPAVTLTVGTGYISTGTSVTVNFRDRTVTQGGTNKNGAVVPGSTWWEVIPGVNTWARTGTASISVAATCGFRDAWL